MAINLELLGSLRTWLIFVVCCLSILTFSLLQEWQNYKKLTAMPAARLEVAVKSAKIMHDKNGMTYTSLTLEGADGWRCYAGINKDMREHIESKASVLIDTRGFGFAAYLGGFRTKLYEFVPLQKEETLKNTAISFIASQHDDPILKELFASLFLDTAISAQLQNIVSNFGLAALLSLSGLNIALLTAAIFFIVTPFYSLLQSKYFPYRNRTVDLMIFCVLLMGFYAYLVEFSPPFMRAYSMMVFGFFLALRGFKVDSFESLFVCCTTLIAANPRFAFSIGFWLSAVGVFYIFVFLRHVKSLKPIPFALLLSFWIYFAILPIIHSIFSQFSFYQLTSPISGLVFDFLYPVWTLLHIVGIGGILDGILSWLLSTKAQTYTLSTPFWFLLFYMTVTLAAARSRFAFGALNVSSVLFFILGSSFGV